MRKAYLLIALACASLAACERKNTNDASVTLPSAYVLNGVTDVTVERDSMVTVNIMVDQQPGRAQENVTLSVTGLPSTVTTKITPESGTPNYHSEITFKASDAAVPGSYPIKIVATSATGSRTYDVNLHIVPITECASKVMGEYTAIDKCDTTTGTEYPVMVSPVFNKQNRVILSGFFGGGGSSSSVTANLECNGKTLTMPKQNIMFYEISGNGSYKKDTITVNYTVMSTFDTVMCTTQLVRKP
ncbi:MAG: hypothetical protein K0R82_1077 [Flavipsychrobacter sp.]|jgi:hypothetical protein|nr:hypothetical protein [Flavipsychrobacter sp.]